MARKRPYAIVEFFTEDGKSIGKYKETDQRRYDDLKTRHNEATMTGLNRSVDNTDVSIRGR